MVIGCGLHSSISKGSDVGCHLCGIVNKESVYYWEILLYGVVPVVIIVILYTQTARILTQRAKKYAWRGPGTGHSKMNFGKVYQYAASCHNKCAFDFIFYPLCTIIWVWNQLPEDALVGTIKDDILCVYAHKFSGKSDIIYVHMFVNGFNTQLKNVYICTSDCSSICQKVQNQLQPFMDLLYNLYMTCMFWSQSGHPHHIVFNKLNEILPVFAVQF
jgi:hypothetical protein